VHVIRVGATAAERRMHALLMRYADAVRAERRASRGADTLLALGVLHKRMLSSAWSLAESVDRRLRTMAMPESDGAQLALPLDDPSGDLVGADQPPEWPAALGLADRDREQRMLTLLLTAAREAAGHETKVRRLATLLRRTRDAVVVFTEYRDTLQHLLRRLARPAVVLPGGFRRAGRAAAPPRVPPTPRAPPLAPHAAAPRVYLPP